MAMAAARVPRYCAALPPIDNFAMNPTFSILRSLPPRPRAPFIARRARRPLPIMSFPKRNFSAVAVLATTPIQPLPQEPEANTRRAKTLQVSEPDAADETVKGYPTLTARPSPSNPTIPTTVPTTKTSLSRFLNRAGSDSDFLKTARRLTGTVIRTQTMAKTVAVATNRQRFDHFLQKHYTRPSKTLVHDPEEILVEGDVIEYGVFPPLERAERIKMGKGKRVKYVLVRVVTPFGAPLKQRRLRMELGESI